VPLRKPRDNFEPDVTSFSDIATLLIIFFILTTTFVATTGSKLEIPSGSADPSQADEKQVTVNLAGSRIIFGPREQEFSIEQLRAALLRENFKAKDPSKRIVIVNSKPDVTYELYYEVVMAIASADGVLALIEEEGKGGPE
jgi:biopolymer transport protein ExbD